MSTFEMLTCENPDCGKAFLRAATGSPARYCSKSCRSRGYYLSHGGVSRKRRPKGRVAPRKPRPRTPERIEYERGYNRRPEVMERQRLRARAEYVPTPRRRKPRFGTYSTIPAPYTGHQWLDAARKAVGTQLDLGLMTEASDRYYDEMGEALLALLEGKDPRQAVTEYRKREFVPRHLTSHIGDWSGGDEDYARDRWDAVMPKAPSAEEEVEAREAVLTKVRYHAGKLGGHMGPGRQAQPSRRRMKDAGWRKNAKQDLTVP
jgi:hypothetical protein